jgi:hypothetical protein
MDIEKYSSRAKFKQLPEGWNHPDSNKFSSNWEYTKTLSNYHFDKWVQEKEGDWFERVGRFSGNWELELKELQEKSKEMTWSDLSSSGKHPGFKTGKSVTIDQETHDRKVRGLENNHYTQLVLHNDVIKHDVFRRMVEYWKLDNVAVRGQVQMPGQCYIMHIDKLWHRNPVDPTKIIRLVINLEDYEPGQLVQYGNAFYSQWRAGDVHVFDTLNVPHSTANMSDKPRSIIIMTGLRTEFTDEKLKKASIDSIYNI